MQIYTYPSLSFSLFQKLSNVSDYHKMITLRRDKVTYSYRILANSDLYYYYYLISSRFAFVDHIFCCFILSFCFTFISVSTLVSTLVSTFYFPFYFNQLITILKQLVVNANLFFHFLHAILPFNIPFSAPIFLSPFSLFFFLLISRSL